MILNVFEHTEITSDMLPNSWQSEEAQNELNDFLQFNWEQRKSFYIDDELGSKQHFLYFLRKNVIKTNKYIGTIIFKGEKLNIYPKVFRKFKGDEDVSDLSEKHLLMNIKNWIYYCNKSEYPFVKISSELDDSEDLMELFITLYVNYVLSIINRGLYYEYVDNTDDLRYVKGRFNVVDYITRKIPNGQFDKLQCNYSSFEYDNKVNQIIKFTCSKLVRDVKGQNLRKIHRILNKMEEVSSIKCVPADCDHIRLNKVHRDYSLIISMSKMILLNKVSNFMMDNNDSFCFLFPAETLFEGFIGGYMKETIESIGGNVKLQQSDMPLIDDVVYGNKSLGKAFTMRHDIVATLNDKIIVLDTKYKEISRFEGDLNNVYSVVKNEPKQIDLYQVLEYARKRNINDVYLLYPMYRFEKKEPDFPIGISNSDTLNINIHFIRLPFVFEEDDVDLESLKEILIDFFKIDSQSKNEN